MNSTARGPVARVSGDQVRRARLPLTGVGRRGLQPAPVAALLNRAAEAITSAEGDIAELAAEIDRLNGYIREQWHVRSQPRSGSGSGGGPPGAGVTQALEVMARAQQVAEQRLGQAEDAERQAHYRAAAAEQRLHAARHSAAIAADQADKLLRDAERDSRVALESARLQYEEIIARAHGRAQQAAQSAMQDFLDCPAQQSDRREQLQARATYLRGMVQVSAAGMRAALEATRSDFDAMVAARDGGGQSRPAALSAR